MRASAEFVKNNLPENLKAVEVGVGHGLNALDMLKGLSIEKLYLVDPYVAYSDDGNDTKGKRLTASQGDMDYAQKKMREYMREFSNNTQILIMSSPEAAQNFEDESLDYVYIDACHFVENVEADIKAWWPKVKKGGVLGGHDYADPPKAPEPEPTVSEEKPDDLQSTVSGILETWNEDITKENALETLKSKLEVAVEKAKATELALSSEVSAAPLEEKIKEEPVEMIVTDNHPGVTSAVNKFVADNNLVLQTGPAGQETDWFIQK